MEDKIIKKNQEIKITILKRIKIKIINN